AGADALAGGAGSDTASYAHATAAVYVDMENVAANTGDAAGDTYTSIENLTGSAFNDTLMADELANFLDGGAGNDLLVGRGENDTLVGGSGADILQGNSGVDTASYINASGGVFADLDNAANNIGDAFGDIYSSIENLTGSNFDDTLHGDSNAN